MKRILSLVLALLLVFVMAGCTIFFCLFNE